jgi:hypothetical protein
MKFRALLAGLSLAGVAIVAPSSFAQRQEQVCPAREVVEPVDDTRVFRSEKFGYRFELPTNYRAMGVGKNRAEVLDPASFQRAQCLVRNKVPTELPAGIGVFVESVDADNRSVREIVSEKHTEITETTTVANQPAIIYTTNLLRKSKNVSFLMPDGESMVTISAPFKFDRNGRIQDTPTGILNAEVFNTILSTFTFVN